MRKIILEERFFRNADEWEYMLVQLGIEDMDAETVEFDAGNIEMTAVSGACHDI